MKTSLELYDQMYYDITYSKVKVRRAPLAAVGRMVGPVKTAFHKLLDGVYALFVALQCQSGGNAGVVGGG